LESHNVLSPNDIFTIHVFGYNIPISDSIIMMWLIMAVIILLAYIFTRNLKTVPTGKQNVVELIVETINNLIKGNIGHHWRPFAPYFGTILLFLVFANTVSLFSLLPTGEELYKITGIEFFEKLPEFAILPPTKDYNVTLAMALMTVFLILVSGIRFKGFKGWLKSFLYPTPIMLPFHILDYGTRTLSLSLRLFGNILAGFIILELLYAAPIPVKALIPVGSAFFDIFDALLQAYIFVFLSSIYISEAVE
jgi:F-type H+-transporting ATPase subunit a